MREHDSIPMLPPMPKPSRRRRRAHRGILTLLVFVTLGTLAALALIARGRYARIADDSLRRAEELFQGGAFHKAGQEFEHFSQEFPRDPRSPSAKRAAGLSNVAKSIDDDLSDPRRISETLATFASDFVKEPDLRERWPIILEMVERHARALLERANRSLSRPDLESANVWRSWLHEQHRAADPGAQRDLRDLDELASNALDAIDTQERRRGFDSIERIRS